MVIIREAKRSLEKAERDMRKPRIAAYGKAV